MSQRDLRPYLDAMGITLWVRRELDRLPDSTGLVPAADESTAGESATPAQDAREAFKEFSPASGPETRGEPTGDRGSPASADWETLRTLVAGCTRCVLHRDRTQTVFGVGRPDAEVMVIGEAPGYHEDRQGEPFVGRAGGLLNRMLQAVGLNRESVFIANVLKCRPPNNRDPQAEEARACRDYLDRQIELVDPQVLLAVGRVSAQQLLDSDAPIGRLRGREHQLPGRDLPLIVTYHPAYLLRSPEQKSKALEDLLMLRDALKRRRASA